MWQFRVRSGVSPPSGCNLGSGLSFFIGAGEEHLLCPPPVRPCVHTDPAKGCRAQPVPPQTGSHECPGSRLWFTASMLPVSIGHLHAALQRNALAGFHECSSFGFSCKCALTSRSLHICRGRYKEKDSF